MLHDFFNSLGHPSDHLRIVSRDGRKASWNIGAAGYSLAHCDYKTEDKIQYGERLAFIIKQIVEDVKHNRSLDTFFLQECPHTSKFQKFTPPWVDDDLARKFYSDLCQALTTATGKKWDVRYVRRGINTFDLATVTCLPIQDTTHEAASADTVLKGAPSGALTPFLQEYNTARQSFYAPTDVPRIGQTQISLCGTGAGLELNVNCHFEMGSKPPQTPTDPVRELAALIFAANQTQQRLFIGGDFNLDLAYVLSAPDSPAKAVIMDAIRRGQLHLSTSSKPGCFAGTRTHTTDGFVAFDPIRQVPSPGHSTSAQALDRYHAPLPGLDAPPAPPQPPHIATGSLPAAAIGIDIGVGVAPPPYTPDAREPIHPADLPPDSPHPPLPPLERNFSKRNILRLAQSINPEIRIYLPGTAYGNDIVLDFERVDSTQKHQLREAFSDKLKARHIDTYPSRRTKTDQIVIHQSQVDRLVTLLENFNRPAPTPVVARPHDMRTPPPQHIRRELPRDEYAEVPHTPAPTRPPIEPAPYVPAREEIPPYAPDIFPKIVRKSDAPDVTTPDETPAGASPAISSVAESIIMSDNFRELGRLSHRLLGLTIPTGTITPDIAIDQDGRIVISIGQRFKAMPGKTASEILTQLQKALLTYAPELKRAMTLDNADPAHPKLRLVQDKSAELLRGINTQILLTKLPDVGLNRLSQAHECFAEIQQSQDYSSAAALCRTLALAQERYAQWFKGEWTGLNDSEKKGFGRIKHSQTGQDRAQKLTLTCCQLLEEGIRHQHSPQKILMDIAKEIHSFMKQDSDKKYAMGATFFKPTTRTHAHSFATFFMRTLLKDPKLGLTSIQKEAADLIKPILDNPVVATKAFYQSSPKDLVHCSNEERQISFNWLLNVLGELGNPPKPMLGPS